MHSTSIIGTGLQANQLPAVEIPSVSPMGRIGLVVLAKRDEQFMTIESSSIEIIVNDYHNDV